MRLALADLQYVFPLLSRNQLTSSGVDYNSARADEGVFVGVPQTLLVTIRSNEDSIDAGAKLALSHDTGGDMRSNAWNVGLEFSRGVIFDEKGDELETEHATETGEFYRDG